VSDLQDYSSKEKDAEEGKQTRKGTKDRMSSMCEYNFHSVCLFDLTGKYISAV